MKEKLEKIDKKTKVFVVGFLILIVVILIGGALLYNRFFYKRSYQEVEEILVTATKNHFVKYPDRLPKNDNEILTITDSDLVAAGEMKSISDYLKDETTTCQGKVTVKKVNDNYRYVAYLDCGSKHEPTKTLFEYVNDNDGTVDNGNGLYQLNNEYVYRGDQVNNYIKFSGKLYRIVKFTEGKALIIYTEKSENKVWDDRYNSDNESNSGINDYSVSRIRDYLNSLYDGSVLISKDTPLISKENKLLVVSHNIGVGRRNSNDTDKTGSLENANVLKNQYIGLLQMNDYLNASLDVNCNNSVSPACVNYNYLSKYKYNWWTLTSSSLNSYRVFRIGANSKAEVANASSSAYVRHVLYLTDDAIYVSGDGTSKKPYIVK